MSRVASRIAALVAVAALAGCGAGDPTYYKLSAWPGTPRSGGPSPIEVSTPTVAPFLDRDYIVSRTEGYELHLAGNKAWAEPIADMIGRVFAADLSQRLTTGSVYPQGSAVGAGDPAARVALDVSRFDMDADGQAVVEASLSVRRTHPEGGTTPMIVPIRIAQTPSGTGTTALVATLSRELGEVADRAADLAVRLPPAFALGDPTALCDRTPGGC